MKTDMYTSVDAVGHKLLSKDGAKFDFCSGPSVRESRRLKGLHFGNLQDWRLPECRYLMEMLVVPTGWSLLYAYAGRTEAELVGRQ